MAKVLRVTFEGLCGFVSRNGGVEVYLMSGHGDHGAHILFRSDFLDVPQTTWRPSVVGLIRDVDSTGNPVLRQAALFSLRGSEARFEDGSGEPQWTKKQGIIDLAVENPNSTTLSKAEIKANDGDVGVVTLAGSQTTLEIEPTTADDLFTLKKNGVKHKTDRFARFVHWTANSNGLPSIANNAGQKIILRKDLAGWWGTVCNVAPLPAKEGLKHFGHYYQGVKVANGDAEMTIENAFADVYDCVPPTAWP